MKIVVIGPVPPYRGGISHHNSNLIEAISTKDNDILSITFSRLYPKFLYPGKDDKDVTQSTTIDSEPIIDMLNPFSWYRCFQRIAEFNPDKVIFHWWTTYFVFFYYFISLLLERKNYHKVCITHNLFPHDSKWFDSLLTKLALRNFDKFIFHSKNEELKFQKLFPQKEHEYFPHPLYDNHLSNRIEKDDAKKKLGISTKKIVILMFGIIRPYKGLNYLILAMEKLIKVQNNYHLLIAGEFWEPITEYNVRINELGISEYVTIHNKYIPEEEVSVYFSATDIFVAPYVGGTQSGALKIALSYDIPIVATSIISDEKENDNANWIVVPPRDSEALGKAINSIQLLNTSIQKKYSTWSEFASFLVNSKTL